MDLNSLVQVKFSKEGKKLADNYIFSNSLNEKQIKVSKNQYNFFVYELVDIFKTKENLKKNIKTYKIIGMSLPLDMFEDDYNKKQMKKIMNMHNK